MILTCFRYKYKSGKLLLKKFSTLSPSGLQHRMIESRPAVNSLFTFESYCRAFTPNLLPGSASLRTVYDTTTLRLALLAEWPPPPRLVVMLLFAWLT